MAATARAQETLFALRRKIAKIEGVLPERLENAGPETHATVLRRGGRPVAETFPLGAARFDAGLGGGLPAAGLIEIHGAATRDAGPAAGFTVALAGLAAGPSGMLVWIGTGEIFREAGWPHAPGLAGRIGIGPDRLLLAQAEKLVDALWIAEEAASLEALAGIVLEIRGSPQALDLTATRRLHRRALAAGHPLFLLRQAGSAEPTAAPIRLVVSPAPAGLRPTLAGALEGSIGPPAFKISIDKSRTSPPATFTLEWNSEARAFEERDHVPAADDIFSAKNIGSLAAAPVDGTDLSPSLREVLAFPPAARNAASGGQPPGGQYATHRRARRAR
jgi:protein ImuA